MAAPWNETRISAALTPFELEQLQELFAHGIGGELAPCNHPFVDFVALEDRVADALALANWKRDRHELELTFDDVEMLTQLIAAHDSPHDPQVEMVSRLHALLTDEATAMSS